MGFKWMHLAAAALAGALAFSLNAAAEAPATPELAQAMVKKAVAFLEKAGKEEVLKAVAQRDGPFVQGEIYVTVTSMDGHTLAHPTNSKLIGRHMIDMQDVDGRYLYRERVELAKKQTSFWHDYKFSNPQTKLVEPKTVYCERARDLIFCAGIYKKP